MQEENRAASFSSCIKDIFTVNKNQSDEVSFHSMKQCECFYPNTLIKSHAVLLFFVKEEQNCMRNLLIKDFDEQVSATCVCSGFFDEQVSASKSAGVLICQYFY